jgi:hypothetical protein
LWFALRGARCSILSRGNEEIFAKSVAAGRDCASGGEFMARFEMNLPKGRKFGE